MQRNLEDIPPPQLLSYNIFGWRWKKTEEVGVNQDYMTIYVYIMHASNTTMCYGESVCKKNVHPHSPAHLSSSATPRSALSMWSPQPAHVALPHPLQVSFQHMMFEKVKVVRPERERNFDSNNFCSKSHFSYNYEGPTNVVSIW